jgi:hypothetical protein
MVNGNDLKEFGGDITRGTAKAVAESFNSTNRNTTLSAIIGGTCCTFCYFMVKNNAIPLLTLTACAGCNIFMFNANYNAVKSVIQAPFRGLFD